MSQYDFYLKSLLLPIAPSQMKLTINNNNTTYVLIDEGEINILKKAKLTDIEFDCTIPQVRHPFAVYPGGFQKAKYFLNYFEKLKTSQKPFQFIVSRTMPSGKVLFSTNIKVSMESYSITDTTKEGFDLIVKIKLKQYRNYSTKTCKVEMKADNSASATTDTMRAPSSTDNAPDSKLPMTYKAVSGDCLWNLAKKYYGDGSKYTLIAKANNMSDPNILYVGDTLTIPEAPQ